MSFFDVENLDSLATIWTIRAALACMFGTFLLRLWELPRSKTKVVLESKSDSPLLDGAKHIWLLGSFFSLLHAMAAMIFYHHGSHALAAADTARQTQALLGISVGAGIYFNYAFVLIWLVDAMWWIAQSDTYLSRHRLFNWLTYGFLIFIAINGTILFETGPVRWISVAALILLSCLILKNRTHSDAPE